MSVVTQRYANIDRFRTTNKTAIAAKQTRTLTLEGFRTSRFNKVLTVLVFVTAFIVTISGVLYIPLIQYTLTATMVLLSVYACWTFSELVGRVLKDEHDD